MLQPKVSLPYIRKMPIPRPRGAPQLRLWCFHKALWQSCKNIRHVRDEQCEVELCGHTYLVTEPGGGDLVLASATLQNGLSLLLDVAVDFSTSVTARLVEASGLASLVVVQSREELSFAGAAETTVSEGHNYALIAMHLGY